MHLTLHMRVHQLAELAGLRSAILQTTTSAAMSEDKRADLELAVHELGANGIKHGLGAEVVVMEDHGCLAVLVGSLSATEWDRLRPAGEARAPGQGLLAIAGEMHLFNAPLVAVRLTAETGAGNRLIGDGEPSIKLEAVSHHVLAPLAADLSPSTAPTPRSVLLRLDVAHAGEIEAAADRADEYAALSELPLARREHVRRATRELVANGIEHGYKSELVVMRVADCFVVLVGNLAVAKTLHVSQDDPEHGLGLHLITAHMHLYVLAAALVQLPAGDGSQSVFIDGVPSVTLGSLAPVLASL